jgi:sugar lactone lactonase YvrE
VRRTFSNRALIALLASAATVGLSAPVAVQAAPVGQPAIPRGVVDVLASVPSPGYPALPLVRGGDIFEGTYTALSGSSVHSHVFKFDASGQLLANFTIADQPAEPYGIQVANADASGQLVVLDDTSGRVMLMNPDTGVTTLYSTIPNIPLCSDAGASSECSEALTEETPEPDYAAWGPDGSLYVTDYQQAVIWRIPPHGGTPSIWLGGSQLDGELFGTAGIWMEPDHTTLLFDQASNLGGTAEGLTGKLYSVQIQPSGAPGTPQLLWTSAPGALPDGFAVAKSGDIYLAQIGPTGNDIIELSSTGQPITTFGTVGTGANGTAIPFDEPSGVAYFDDNLIIANQSFLAGDTAHMALLALGTGELGQRVYIPSDAGPTTVVPPPATKTKPVTRTHPVKRRHPVKRKHRPRDAAVSPRRRRSEARRSPPGR